MWPIDGNGKKQSTAIQPETRSLPWDNNGIGIRNNNAAIFNRKIFGHLAQILCFSILCLVLLLSWIYLHEISVTTHVNQGKLNFIAEDLEAIKHLLRYSEDDNSRVTEPQSQTSPMISITTWPTPIQTETTSAPVTPSDIPGTNSETLGPSTIFAITLTPTPSTTEATLSSTPTTDIDPTELYSITDSTDTASTEKVVAEKENPVSVLNNISGKEKIYHCSLFCTEPLIFRGILLYRNTIFNAFGLEKRKTAKHSVAFQALKKFYPDHPEGAGKVCPIDSKWLDEESLPNCTDTIAVSRFDYLAKKGNYTCDD